MNKFLVLLVLISGCSFKKDHLENQTQKGHEELYSEPDAPEKINKGLKRVVIAATNDLEGLYSQQSLPYSDSSSKPGTIQVGGVDIISSYFSILRKKYGNVVLVDSGDLFSSDAKDAPAVSEFYETLSYDALTIGLTDFNVKMTKSQGNNANFFKEFAKTSKTPLVLSNLYDLKTARLVEWQGSFPYILKEVDGVKVGILGLVPDDIVSQTPVDNRVGLYVESMLQSTLRQARLLRSLGAEIIVVLTPQGLDCGIETSQNLKLPLLKVNFEPKAKKICDVQGSLGEYLMRLPPHLVDVVIGGRNHQKVANYVNETLVLSSFGQGASFSYVEFFIDDETKKLNKDKTVVHQPVMFCREFFKETKDCFNEDTSVNHKVKMPATFLGENLIPDTEILKKFEEYLKKLSTQNKVKTSMSLELINNALTAFDAHVSYFKESKGHTQLLVLDVNAQELSTLLEEELNGSQEKHWRPSPFKKNGDDVQIVLNAGALVPDQRYRILSDLESLQKHHVLRKLIHKKDIHPLMSYSLNSLLNDDIDEISTLLSQRQH